MVVKRTPTTTTTSSPPAKPAEETAQNEPSKEEVRVFNERPPTMIPLIGIRENDDEYPDLDNDSPADFDLMKPGIIFQKMVDVMKDVDAIVKTKQRDSGVPYAFRSIEDVMNALHPILSEHGVFIMPVDSWTENLVHPRPNKGPSFQCIYNSAYRFYATDGSFVEGHMVAESIDYSDKATQQASSYCYKNIILQAFCVPTRDVVGDGDDKKPDRTDEGRPPVQPSPRMQNLPSPSQLPPTGSPMYDPMKPEDWDAVKAWFKSFVPLGFNKDSFHHWCIKTLRANALDVPPHLKDLPRTSGLILNQIAQRCHEIGATVTSLTQEKDEADFILLTELPSEVSESIPESAPRNQEPPEDLGTDGAL